MKLEADQIERFWSKVEKTDSCWLWTAGQKNPEGYGGFYVRQIDNTVSCHKIAFCIEHNFGLNDIPEGIVIRHLCNNHPCVNPSHLALGTYKDNSQDMVAAGNSVGGEKNWKSKVDRAKVLEMRRLWSTGEYTKSQLAELFQITDSTVWQIITNRTWKDSSYVPITFSETKNKACKFTHDQVQEIKEKYKSGIPVRSLVVEYNISMSQVYNILHGRQRKGGNQ
jgi:hypothetical protein